MVVKGEGGASTGLSVRGNPSGSRIEGLHFGAGQSTC